MARQLFLGNKTYANRENAMKVINKLVEGDYTYLIAVTEDSRFFPVIFLSSESTLNFHYFISKGCSVQII